MAAFCDVASCSLVKLIGVSDILTDYSLIALMMVAVSASETSAWFSHTT
jgi:hypothetical protein